MNFNKFLTVVLNEGIKVNGKSLDDEEDKKDDQPNYAGDGPEPDEEEDDTDKNPSPNDNPDDEDPDYTGDGPEPDDEDENPSPDDEDPDYTGDGPEPDDEEDNPDDQQDNTDGQGDNPDDEDENPDYTSDKPESDDEEDNPDDQQDNVGGQEDNQDDEDENPDYTSDKPESDDEDDVGGAGAEDNTGGDSASGGDSEIQDLENDLFSELTPAQIAIKQTELKTQFITLYGNIEKTIDRLAKVNRVEDNIKPLEFVTLKLMQLKDLVRDSLIESYDTRSYVENQIMLQRLMAIFATLMNIVEELAKGKDKT